MKIPPLAALILTSSQLMAQGPAALAPLLGKFVPAAGQEFFLDLDTAAGKFSQWRKNDLEGLSALRTELRFERFVKDSRWFPTCTITLASGDKEAKANRLSLQFVAPNGKAPIVARIIGHLNGSPVEDIPLTTTLKLGERVMVEVRWAEANLIRVRVGDGDSREVRVPWGVDHLQLTGSTGEATFDPLVLGSISR